MSLFDQIPIPALFILTSLFVLLGIAIGFRWGRLEKDSAQAGREGTIVQATLGLLAFLLAFTFGVAAERFNSRRLLIIDEANAIGTTFLRADFLPEANKKEVRNLLREYVGVRIIFSSDGTRLSETEANTNRLQTRLWAEAKAAGNANLNSAVIGLFIASLNETIDLSSKRLAAQIYSRIPGFIWCTLYALVFLGMMTLGFQLGTGRTWSWPITVTLVFSFAIVIIMIADLDRPTEGFLRACPQPLIDQRDQMGPAEANPDNALKK